MPRLYCYFLAISLISAGGALHAQFDRGKQFKTNVLAEWKSLLETINTVRWEKETEYHSSRDRKHLSLTGVEVTRRAFKRSAGMLSSSEVDDINESMKRRRRWNEVRITNSKYTAELKRSNKGDGWVLTELKNESKDLAERLSDEVHCPWMQLGPMRLNKCLQYPSFVFTRIEEIPDRRTTGLLRAYFEYEAEPGLNADLIKSGYIDFDAKRSYCPMRYQFNMKSDLATSIVSGVLEYDNSQGIPVLKVMITDEESRSDRKGGLLFAKEIETFSNVQYNGNVPDQEFRLSFYDMPEPQGVVWPKSSRWWLWFVFLGLVSIGVGAWFRHRLRRRKVALAQNPKAGLKVNVS